MYRFSPSREDGVWSPLTVNTARKGCFARSIREAYTQSEGVVDVRLSAGDLIRIELIDNDGDASIEALFPVGCSDLWGSSDSLMWLLRESFDAFEVWQPLSAVNASAAKLRAAGSKCS